MDYFIFGEFMSCFIDIYRYKFVGEIHLDKSRLKRKCLRTMRQPMALQIASTSQMMVGLAGALTVQAGSA